MSKPVIALVGALDTKGAEYAFLRSRIEAAGCDAIYIDFGVFGPADGLKPEVTAEEVAIAGGCTLAELIEEKDRGHAMEVMTAGVAEIARKLYEEGKLQGVIAMGGGGGTTVGTSAMRALPIGVVPKVMVSTIAGGDVSNYVGESDITMMPSIVDIAGINKFSSMILANAAAAVTGMALQEKVEATEEKPLIAATMFGVTTPCVTHAKEVLEAKGYEVLIFHAVGSGGKTMESLIRSGCIQGVLDLTTTEWCDELAGGILSAGPNRLEAAGEMGVTQIVSAGALDMVNFGPMDSIPAKYEGRLVHPHNPLNTLMRTTVDENKELGKIIAGKLNKATGKTIFLMPMKGVSMMDAEGGVFYDPEADAAFLAELEANLNDSIELIKVDAHINDPEFAELAVDLLCKNI